MLLALVGLALEAAGPESQVEVWPVEVGHTLGVWPVEVGLMDSPPEY